ncbi:MAG: helicase-related protein [Elusimicrobiota bacterium]
MGYAPASKRAKAWPEFLRLARRELKSPRSFRRAVKRALGRLFKKGATEKKLSLGQVRQEIAREILHDRRFQPHLIVCDEFQRYRAAVLPHGAGIANSPLQEMIESKTGPRVLFVSATPLEIRTIGQQIDRDAVRRFIERLSPSTAEKLFGAGAGYEQFEKKLTDFIAAHGAEGSADTRKEAEKKLVVAKETVEKALASIMVRTERPQHKANEQHDLADPKSWNGMGRALAAMLATANKEGPEFKTGAVTGLWLSSLEFSVGGTTPLYAYARSLTHRELHRNLSKKIRSVAPQHWKVTALHKRVEELELGRKVPGGWLPTKLWISPSDATCSSKVLIFATWRAALREAICALNEPKLKKQHQKLGIWATSIILDGPIFLNSKFALKFSGEFIAVIAAKRRATRTGTVEAGLATYNQWLQDSFGLRDQDPASAILSIVRKLEVAKSLGEVFKPTQELKLNDAAWRAFLRPLVKKQTWSHHVPGRCFAAALARILTPGDRIDERDLESASVALHGFLTRPIATAVLRGDSKGREDFQTRLARYCERHSRYQTLVEYLDWLCPSDTSVDRSNKLKNGLKDLVTSLSLVPASLRPSLLTHSRRRAVFNHWAQPFGLKQSEKKRDSSVGSETTADPKRRVAFNSPFFPFVLVASQAGEEGLDFHGYCSHVIHWDVVSDAASMVQREGRVYRYRCLALRNIFRKMADKDGFKWLERAMQEERQTELPVDFAHEKARIRREFLVLPFTEEAHRRDQFLKHLHYLGLMLGQVDSRSFERLDRVMDQVPKNRHSEILKRLPEFWIRLAPKDN